MFNSELSIISRAINYRRLVVLGIVGSTEVKGKKGEAENPQGKEGGG